MKRRLAAHELPLALGIGACGDDPVAPQAAANPGGPLLQRNARPERGTGLALTSFTEGLPIIGDVEITQIVITEFATSLAGLKASGTITRAGASVPGLTVTETFTTDVLVSSTGFGRCELVRINLGPIGSRIIPGVEVDIPEATVSGQASGAVGPLLCALGSVVNTVAGGVVRGLVNALNALLR